MAASWFALSIQSPADGHLGCPPWGAIARKAVGSTGGQTSVQTPASVPWEEAVGVAGAPAGVGLTSAPSPPCSEAAPPAPAPWAAGLVEISGQPLSQGGGASLVYVHFPDHRRW